MKVIYYLLILVFIGCGSKEEKEERSTFSQVEIETILEDSVSVRAIEVMGNNLAFASNRGWFGFYNDATGEFKVNLQEQDTLVPEFRAVASTENDFFMLSVGNPALLYKTGDTGQMELVYREDNEKVFYDAMTFWNDNEGIAMGDPTDSCLSIIITRDGGKTWNKLNCDILPEVVEGEAAFAASNSNIAVLGNNAWILSGGMSSRIFFTADKGNTWEVFETPLKQGTSTTGGYSLDFYNNNKGIIVGGDYTQPDDNTGNIAVTEDGGKTWKLVSEGKGPGYLSSVRYVPGRGGNEIVGAGPNGISYSLDGGENWETLTTRGFHTIRFVTDSTAYAGGNNRIAKLKFK
ncbi:oxidoreductase [Antarcticibacterium arcticum]|uniref:Oxidoreductase n=1 Tax=Antarcticibacterium arcticum TaxID=2585771 RepID=A0A5B8YI20_9FLAO|nr:oxidoreductase [Antarcticibacterium arcticum]QED37261.1 oxidoreductase [Antarcticibacterium arcticum]